MSIFDASVIISTYNQPQWLLKVLWSYDTQTTKNFEILICDDGSTKETKKIIEDFVKTTQLSVKHLWQEDNGFRKSKILNKGILEATSDYLIFTDGDCIARQDFVETHLKLKDIQYCLSGGYFKLPESISESITRDDIISQNCFDLKWLLERGLNKNFKTNKLTSFGFKSWFLNNLTTTKATFDGMNVSGYKDDILAVNGFDERMHYGGEDRELGERLINSGIKFKQIRYSAICVHLHHSRPYANDEKASLNKKIRTNTKKKRLAWTNYGIKKVKSAF